MKPVATPVALAIGLAGCVHAPEPRQTPSAPVDNELMAASDEPGTPWEQCHASFSPSGSPEADLARLTSACGPVGGMQAVTAVHLGQQNHRDPVDRFSFYVPEPGKCYRVYATGDETIGDLDLLLRDPAGNALAADLTHDSAPVLPPAEPFCVDAPGAYLLEISVYRGSGRYAVQVWGK